MPIRYVLAVALAVAVLSVAFVGLEEYARDSTQQHMEEEIAELSQTAALLYESEEAPPPGQEGAQRYVTVTLPDDSLTSDAVDYLRIEQLAENVSQFEYRLAGGSRYQHQASVPIVVGGGADSMNLTGSGAEHELVLVLEADRNGDPVVRIRRATTTFQLTVSSGDGGTVRVDGEEHDEYQGTHEWGTEVELVAEPGSGDRWFESWGGDVPYGAASRTVTVTMNKDRNITAAFAEHAIEVDVNPGGSENEVNAILLRRNGSLVDSVEAYEDEGFVDLPHRFTDLDPGNYSANVYAMDMLAARANISFEEGQTNTTVLDAQKYVPVEYVIEDTDGNPVSGAVVEVRTHEDDPDELWRNVTTGEDGTTTVHLQQSLYNNTKEFFNVTVLYNGTVVDKDQIGYAEEETRTLEIETPGTNQTGRLRAPARP